MKSLLSLVNLKYLDLSGTNIEYEILMSIVSYFFKLNELVLDQKIL